MSKTAFDAMLDLARRAGPLVEGVATGGSSTTIVDTNLLGVFEFNSDSELNGGTAFIISDTAGAAPQGETARIIGYNSAQSTVTVAGGDFSAAPAAGDTYGVTAVPRYQLLQAINAALRDFGPVPQVDESLTTVSGTREYSLPGGITPKDLYQVWYQTNTDRPYDYERMFAWRVVHARDSYNLELFDSLPGGHTLRLVYVAPNSQLTSDSSTISDYIPWDYLIWQASAYLYQRRLLQVGVDREHWTGLMNHAFQMAANVLKTRGIYFPQRQRLAIWPEYSQPGIETEPIEQV